MIFGIISKMKGYPCPYARDTCTRDYCSEFYYASNLETQELEVCFRMCPNFKNNEKEEIRLPKSEYNAHRPQTYDQDKLAPFDEDGAPLVYDPEDDYNPKTYCTVKRRWVSEYDCANCEEGLENGMCPLENDEDSWEDDFVDPADRDGM